MSQGGCQLNIVLVEPEIPPNTGNVARLCAATNTKLHLIEPLGFELTDKQLKRAGMDYWEHVDWCKWPSWIDFSEGINPSSRLWLIESGGGVRHSDAKFAKGDYLVFGRETLGLPERLCFDAGKRWLRIPMFNADARSLNLSNCVSLVLYEALRQLDFDGEL
ncbi:MAG: tRNA (cytidine(34)-2'-O)-methyltransferase [Verrucomicrobiota bacterium]|nr:tRNA (cytidine(34)-2'-O)-methyltransferase [Verrucomicrobiota bacterium]